MRTVSVRESLPRAAAGATSARSAHRNPTPHAAHLDGAAPEICLFARLSTDRLPSRPAESLGARPPRPLSTFVVGPGAGGLKLPRPREP